MCFVGWLGHAIRLLSGSMHVQLGVACCRSVSHCIAIDSDMVVLTGLIGLLAAILVGAGEYLLHYDALARFSATGYDYLRGIPAERSTTGHFLGVFGAILYPVGCFHIYLMLRPANQRVAFAGFLLASAGFIVGVVWIGSRASISALVNLPPSPDIESLIALYSLRYETLLQFIRLTTLILSLIIVWLSVGGRSRYPRWIGVFNPILLIVANFLLFAWAPSIGKHTMPIALNVAFFIFFLLSTVIALAGRSRASQVD